MLHIFTNKQKYGGKHKYRNKH